MSAAAKGSDSARLSVEQSDSHQQPQRALLHERISLSARTATSHSSLTSYSRNSEASAPPAHAELSSGKVHDLASGGRSEQPPSSANKHIPDVLELAKGSETLLRRLGDVSAANAALRHQLETQFREIGQLEESGRQQQHLLHEYERRVEQSRQQEVLALEHKMRVEAAEHEARLQAEIAAVKEEARLERDDLLERLKVCDNERARREGERDEARARVADLELRLSALIAAPPATGSSDLFRNGITANLREPASLEPAPRPSYLQVVSVVESQRPSGSILPVGPESMGLLQTPLGYTSRETALEMELSLLRTRFLRESAMRVAAERAASDAQQEQQRLQTDLDRSMAKVRYLTREVEKHSEQVLFSREQYNDLETCLRQQEVDFNQKLKLERHRFAALQRLEGVLPKHMLMKEFGLN